MSHYTNGIEPGYYLYTVLGYVLQTLVRIFEQSENESENYQLLQYVTGQNAPLKINVQKQGLRGLLMEKKLIRISEDLASAYEFGIL